MRKLEHDILITVPEEMRKELDKETSWDFSGIEKFRVEIYHIEDIDDVEIYRIYIPELDDDFQIEINSLAMDISREIQEEGGGNIEEFIFQLALNHLKQIGEEQEARDFFDEISD